ncbi:HEXXH motif-containing putative peptide modification protein [Botrimarina sp.]|uniref:aKG-HExxH-type peptide beta-hydroxylase n=1 Tax=Botrimarina sp. TaxID=2795802 RepID=UPI0032EF8F03
MDAALLTDRELLWTDNAVHAERVHKSARALARIVASLTGGEPADAAASEFIALFNRAAAAPADVFSELWSEPFAYYWARTAWELSAALRGEGERPAFVDRYVESTGAADLGDAFARHLDLFKLFAAGLAVRSGEAVEFHRPLPIAMPFALVGTRLSFSGGGELALCGAGPETLLVEHDGQRLAVPVDPDAAWTHPGVRRHVCPEVSLGASAMRMQPHAMKLPDLVSMRQDPLPTPGLQEEMQPHLADAVAAIQRYLPDAADQLRYGGRLAVVKQRSETGPTNASFSRLPGAVLFSARREPLVLADDLLHEVHHNRLYALEEGRPFFDNRRVNATTDARFYSPWRADPRPLYGIFHAVYVFTRVKAFWLGAYRSGDLNGDRLAYATDRLVRFREQLSTGVGVLRDSADFTPFGQRLFDAVSAEVERLIAEAQSAGLPDDAPAMVCLENGRLVPELGLDTGAPITVTEAIDEHRRYAEPALQAANGAASAPPAGRATVSAEPASV